MFADLGRLLPQEFNSKDAVCNGVEINNLV